MSDLWCPLLGMTFDGPLFGVVLGGQLVDVVIGGPVIGVVIGGPVSWMVDDEPLLVAHWNILFYDPIHHLLISLL